MRAADIAAALVAFGAAAAMLLGAWRLEYWLEFAPGPGFFPRWVALGAGAVALALLAGALRRQGPSPLDWPDRAGVVRVGGAALALVLFVPAVAVLGFVTAATLFMLVLLLAIERCRLLPSLVSTTLTVALIHGVFVRWLGVPLPRGPFGF